MFFFRHNIIMSNRCKTEIDNLNWDVQPSIRVWRTHTDSTPCNPMGAATINTSTEYDRAVANNCKSWGNYNYLGQTPVGWSQAEALWIPPNVIADFSVGWGSNLSEHGVDGGLFLNGATARAGGLHVKDEKTGIPGFFDLWANNGKGLVDMGGSAGAPFPMVFTDFDIRLPLNDGKEAKSLGTLCDGPRIGARRPTESEPTTVAIGPNSINNMRHGAFMSWSDYLKNCCVGKVTMNTAANCRTYAPGQPRCAARFLTPGNTIALSQDEVCTIDQIKKGGICRDICANNPKECDKLISLHCKANPNDSHCLIYNVKGFKPITDDTHLRLRRAFELYNKLYPNGYEETCWDWGGVPTPHLQGVFRKLEDIGKDFTTCRQHPNGNPTNNFEFNIDSDGYMTVDFRRGSPAEESFLQEQRITTASQNPPTTDDGMDVVMIVVIILCSIGGLIFVGLLFYGYKKYKEKKQEMGTLILVD
jgi:hypothetical protein